MPKIYVYIHVCCINNWQDVFRNMLHQIHESGLYDKINEIRTVVIGDIEEFNYAYAETLDAMDVDGWVEYFTEDAFYHVIARDNAESGLPLGLIYCEGKAMMICVPRDEKNLTDIEALVQKQIPRIDNPVATSNTEAETDKAEDTAPKKRSRSSSRRSAKNDAPQEPAETAAAEPAEPPRKSSRGKGGKSDSERGSSKVVGMGDHMPSFIALSFEERRAG